MHIGTRRLARGLVALALLALPAVGLAGNGAWTETTNENAPWGRIYQLSAWTGSRLVIWGGYNGSGGCGSTNTGGLYDPATDTWTATSTTDAPEARGRGRPPCGPAPGYSSGAGSPARRPS